MWSDNETHRDFLNFTAVANTVAEIISQSKNRPISIGVSGAWGVGKSSMLKLIRHALEQQDEDIIFVEFNAWLYQGYDDARAALLEVVARTLADEAKRRKTGLDKAKELMKRVDWFRMARFTAGSIMPLAFGLPPMGALGEVLKLFQDKDNIGTEFDAKAVSDQLTGLFRSKLDSSPPQEIHALRESFEQSLKSMGVRLIVLIDDLDRCLPTTTISTLEAIRLLLFLDHTGFVIAADDEMIKHAVRSHFDDVSDDRVINYFDKLIQVPIRVPPLGTQEVRAYLMLLFIENSELSDAIKEKIRAQVIKQLGQTWRGLRVDRAFIQTTHDDFPPELMGRFDTADRLAPLLTTATQVSGNPRLIKRILNALSIRMAISKAHGVGVDEAVLAKMLLFERCASPAAYDELTTAVNNDSEGRPQFLVDWEKGALAGQELTLKDPWDDPFIFEWLTIPPRLAELDLRGVLYVSREHAPLISPEDRLSSEAAEVLTAILEHPDMAAELTQQLRRLSRPETTIIMDRLLERARLIQEWGTPPILNACIAVASVDLVQGSRLVAFLRDRPPEQIKPSIVPKIADQPWALDLLNAWKESSVSAAVKNAISRRLDGHGNI